jgi:hypothetical protein
MPTDRVTRWFLAAVALGGIAYVCAGWTPTSYGFVLEEILKADNSGPVAGTARVIRSDEWAVATPTFQAAVRNRFQRINETSFYREDLRCFYALPLADWSLIFKPQLWAFFVGSPATAFSLYFALEACAFLAGYQLLFRQLGIPGWLAVAGALVAFFSGFTQFWWTTYGPLLAGLPWALLAVLLPLRWWKKALLCAWVFPAVVFSHVYPTLLLTLAWGSLILLFAVRPSLLRSPGDLVAIAVGLLVTAIAVYAYYAELIPIIRNTVYPGHRIGTAGGTPILVTLSQVFPFLTFRLGDYQYLTGPNICEIGTLGSFLPLATLCLMRYGSLKGNPIVKKALPVLLAGFAAITLWEVAPLPAWIGHILLWDTGNSNRWLFISGLLLTVASLLIWSSGMISPHPARIALFVAVGPVSSLALKIAWLIHKGQPAEAALSGALDDFIMVGIALLLLISMFYIPESWRTPAVVFAIALMNVYAFAGFNPLQPARPIFEIPNTTVMEELRKKAAAAPDGVLVETGFSGGVLNGLGFRSVSHVLMAPHLAIFRRYFPDLQPQQFNWLFNRYELVVLTHDSQPNLPRADVVELPIDAFTSLR